MRFAHINIVAKDPERLSQFYVRVFRCTPKPPERRLSGSWLDRATGLKSAKLKGVHLLLPGHGPQGPTIEIFQYRDRVDSELKMANHTGFTHMAFEVEDVQRTFDEAMKNGAEPLGKIAERSVEGVGFLSFVYLRDPEGNIVEIQSWKP